MMLPPTGRRTPILALTAVAVGLFVVGGILLVGRLGVPAEAPSPSSSGPSAAPTDPTATPEGAVRAFFVAFAAARRTDDPTAIASLVTSTNSSAYLTVSGFLAGQKAVGTASVLTVNDLTNLVVAQAGAQATVTFLHHQVGFDVSVDSGQPKESPTALPDVRVQVVVIKTGARWLVDSFENLP
jgi:hypothetical protein